MIKKCNAFIFESNKNTLKAVEIKLDTLKPNEVLIKHNYIGLNFGDTQAKVPSQNFIVPGIEAAGIIVEIGNKVKEFKVGDRVAYATVKSGAYAEYNIVSKEHIIPIPKNISDEAAASFLTKGLTAHFLVRRTFFLRPEHKILVHAAAGGVGHLIVRLAKNIGAEIIGTIGNNNKQKFLLEQGADHIINYNDKIEFSKEILNITNQNGVSVVYDSIGTPTFVESIKSLTSFGLMVCFGKSSGIRPKIDSKILESKSLFLTSPKLTHYKNNRAELVLSAMEVFNLIEQKILPNNPQKVYDFKDIPQAHTDLLNRLNVGCSVIKI